MIKCTWKWLDHYHPHLFSQHSLLQPHLLAKGRRKISREMKRRRNGTGVYILSLFKKKYTTFGFNLTWAVETGSHKRILYAEALEDRPEMIEQGHFKSRATAWHFLVWLCIIDNPGRKEGGNGWAALRRHSDRKTVHTCIPDSLLSTSRY